MEKPTRKEMQHQAAIEYAKTGSKTRALERSNYSRNTAHKQQRRTFDRIMENAGNAAVLTDPRLADETLAKKLGDLSEAKTIAGKSEHVIDDNSAQLRAVEMVLRLKGYLRDERDVQAVLVTVQQCYDQQFVQLLKEFVPQDRWPALMRRMSEIAEAAGSSVKRPNALLAIASDSIPTEA